MRRYALAWIIWWGGLTAVGVTFGAHAWSVGAAVGVVVLAGLATAMFGMVELVLPGRSPAPVLHTVETACFRAVTGGLVGLSVVMVAGVVGLLVWPLLALAFGTSPWVLGWLLRWRSRSGVTAPAARPGCAEVQPADVTAASWASVVREMSTEDLCRSWRASFHALRSAPSARAYAELVSLREAYIDELERRDPRGTKAWLGSGTRAAGSPARFLAPGGP